MYKVYIELPKNRQPKITNWNPIFRHDRLNWLWQMEYLQKLKMIIIIIISITIYPENSVNV